MKGVGRSDRIVPLVLAMTAALLSPSAADAVESYTMVCRGGGAMRAFVWKTLPDDRGWAIRLAFQKSPHAASQQPPDPGQCAWVDRPINQQEPSELSWSGSDYIFSLDVTQSATRITEIRGGRLGYLLDAVRLGNQFYVRCHNNRHGYFHITHFGP
jgi:hypothetical protein